MWKNPYRVTFVSSLFSPDGLDREASNVTLGIFLDALTAADVVQMRSAPLPLLYEAGVRYQAEPPGKEDWLDAIQVAQRKHADCEDLASYRAAELRVKFGVNARAVFIFALVHGRQLYHCRVRYPVPNEPASYQHPSATIVVDEQGQQWVEEDPSVVLGMRSSR